MRGVKDYTGCVGYFNIKKRTLLYIIAQHHFAVGTHEDTKVCASVTTLYFIRI